MIPCHRLLFTKSKFVGGYIGLLALLVAVVIGIVLIFKQWESLGMLKSSTPPNLSSSSTSMGEPTSSVVVPIEQAKKVKNMIESQDRMNNLAQ